MAAEAREAFAAAVAAIRSNPSGPSVFAPTLEQIDRVVDATVAPPPLASLPMVQDRTALLAALGAYDSLLERLRGDATAQRDYAASGEDFSLFAIPVLGEVPRYFANVAAGQSPYQRKILAALGLRNLIVAGPHIYSRLRAALFSSRPEDYVRTGRRGGVPTDLLTKITGNTVDLDTCIGRCHDGDFIAQLSAAKARDHPGSPPLVKGFAASQDPWVLDVMRAQTAPLLEDFCASWGLDAAAAAARRVAPLDPRQPVHVARGVTDRGAAALWLYSNPMAQVASFHVNVPNVADIAGALLRAPWLAAHAWATVAARGLRGDEVARVWEECLDDRCLNGKWRAVAAFHASLFPKGDPAANLLREAVQAAQREAQVELGRLYQNPHLDDEAQARGEAEIVFGRIAAAAAAPDADPRLRAITPAEVRACLDAINAAV